MTRRLLVVALLLTVGLAFIGEPAYAADGVAQLQDVITRFIKPAIVVAGVVAVLIMVWGGFQLMTSSGRPDKLQAGKETIKWAVIGLIVVIAAYAIVEFVVTAAKSSFGG